MSVPEPRSEQWYRAVWRWHFYAGLLCLPFVLWLSVTGGIYLFKPQIEDALYAPYRNVAQGPSLSPDAIAHRAVAAVPGSVLHKYVLAGAPNDATQVLVTQGGRDFRVWVRPDTGQVLYRVAEDERMMRVVFRLHGELLAGNLGSALVETAACWTVIMLVTGLFLWWPRGGARIAGVLYPRLRRGKRVFWRDIHAVTGIWVSLAAAFLIFTGLPWANAWGSYFRDVRALTGTAAVRQDWSAGSSNDAAALRHDEAAMHAMAGHEGHDMGPMMSHPVMQAGLDQVVRSADGLRLAGPVEVSLPTIPGEPWQVRSQADNRPRRDSAEIAADGTLVGMERFADRHWIDRAVGYGVAIHEGAWWGLANQLANLAVLIGLVTLCVSAAVMWWRRRPKDSLGAPQPLAPLRHSWALVAIAIALALAMPLFGLSLALATLVEVALGRSKALSRWMGWRTARA